MDWSSLLSALIGAVIGGAISWLSAWQVGSREWKRQRREEAMVRFLDLGAVRVEGWRHPDTEVGVGVDDLRHALVLLGVYAPGDVTLAAKDFINGEVLGEAREKELTPKGPDSAKAETLREFLNLQWLESRRRFETFSLAMGDAAGARGHERTRKEHREWLERMGMPSISRRRFERQRRKQYRASIRRREDTRHRHAIGRHSSPALPDEGLDQE